MLRLVSLLTGLLTLNAFAGANEDEIYQRLEHRWFDVEVIVFERLDQFEFNNVERLTSTTPPTWSNGMVEYTEYTEPTALSDLPDPIDPTRELSPNTRPLTYPSIHCIGFPLLPEALSLHPVLVAVEQAAEEERLRQALRLEEAFFAQQTRLLDILLDDQVRPRDRKENPTTDSLDALPVPPDAGLTENIVSDAQTAVTETPDIAKQTSGPGAGIETLMPEDSPNLTDDPASSLSRETETDSTAAVSPFPVIETRPTPEALFATHLQAFEADLVQQTFVYSPETKMDAAVRAINRQKNLRPLFHRRWRQVTPPREAPIKMRLDLPAADARLRGTLDVTVARYLHFNVDLWYETTTLGQAPRLFSSDGASETPDTTERYIHVAERRRMRSQEVHYLDHPKLGIVIRIDPLPIPEELLSLYSELETETLY